MGLVGVINHQRLGKFIEMGIANDSTRLSQRIFMSSLAIENPNLVVCFKSPVLPNKARFHACLVSLKVGA